MIKALQVDDLVGNFQIVGSGRSDPSSGAPLAYLGAGGFAVTYKVERKDEGQGGGPSQLVSRHRHWALKECFPDYCAVREANGDVSARPGYEHDFAWAMGRFLEEAILLQIVRHDHIVRVEGILIERGTIYMLMEYVSGETLGDRVKRQGPQTVAQVEQWLPSLLSALTSIHTPNGAREAEFKSVADRYRNDVLPAHPHLRDVTVGAKSGSVVLHLDLTPSNIMFHENDGLPVLIDFGSARQKLSTDPSQESGVISKSVVTPDYAPFEQYVRKFAELGPRTDLFSLGGCVCFALTGKPPEFNALARRDQDRDPLPKLTARFGSNPVTRTADTALSLRVDKRPVSAEAWRVEVTKRSSGAVKRPRGDALRTSALVAAAVLIAVGAAVMVGGYQGGHRPPDPPPQESQGSAAAPQLVRNPVPDIGKAPDSVAPPDASSGAPAEPVASSFDPIKPVLVQHKPATPKPQPTQPPSDNSSASLALPPVAPPVRASAAEQDALDQAARLLLSGQCQAAADRVSPFAASDPSGDAYYDMAVNAATSGARRAYFGSAGERCPSGPSDETAKQYLQRAAKRSSLARQALSRMP
jgi:serine/threonine protein kinase